MILHLSLISLCILTWPGNANEINSSLPIAVELFPRLSASAESIHLWNGEVFDLESLGNRPVVYVLNSNPQNEFSFQEEEIRTMRQAERQVYLVRIYAIAALTIAVCLAINLTSSL